MDKLYQFREELLCVHKPGHANAWITARTMLLHLLVPPQ